ncbi:MAG: hypothetical protein VX938_13475, partial [Myxococcota bacterium]|nr:hypothetical protein [Myxococcota bacterium]
ILYELCAGETPFAGEDVAVLVRHLDESIPELPEKLVDGEAPTDAIRYVLGRLMAKDPSERPGSTANVALALECLARGEPVDMKNLLDATVPEPDPHAENPDVVMPMGDATAATMAQGVISQDASGGGAGRAEAGSLQGGGGTVAWESVDPPPGSAPPDRGPSTGSRPLPGLGRAGEVTGQTRAVGTMGPDEQSSQTRAVDTLPPVPEPSRPAQTGMSRQVQAKPKGSSKVMQLGAVLLVLTLVGGGYVFMDQQEKLEDSRRKMNQGIQMQHPGGVAPGQKQTAAQAEEAAKNQDPLQAILNGEELKGGKATPRQGAAARATRRKGRGEPEEAAPVIQGADGLVKSVDVTGRIPKEDVEKLIKEASSTLTGCFAKTQTGKAAKGELDVQVIVLHTGWVASVTVKPASPSA